MMDGEVSSYLRGCNSILNSYQDIEDLIDQVDGVMGDVDKILAQDWTAPMNMSYSTLEEIADVLRQIQELRCD